MTLVLSKQSSAHKIDGGAATETIYRCACWTTAEVYGHEYTDGPTDVKGSTKKSGTHLAHGGDMTKWHV